MKRMSADGTKPLIKNKDDLNANTAATRAVAAFSYPACWADNQRMDVLLAPFRVRSVNPENYDSKMKFWQDLTTQYCTYKGSAVFSKRELQLQFARGERLPKCLDAVLEEMLATRELRSRADYEYDPANSWSGWATSLLVRRPLAWGLTKLRNSVGGVLSGGAPGGEDQQQQGLIEWVHLDVMKQLCFELHAQVLQPQQGKLLHYAAVRELVAKAAPALHLVGDDCLRLCLHTLHAQRRIGLEWQPQQEGGARIIHLVKVPAKTDMGSAVVITESDRAIHNLQMTQTSLLQQLEQLANDIKANETKARDYLKENKRQLAKTYLRKKQMLEKNHEKRSLALLNIETLLCSVDEAQSNGEILDAYKIGSKALQTALNESGLKYDNVDEVLADVRDTIETHQEVQDALANANVTTTAADEDVDELERELQEIMGGDANTPQRPKTKIQETAATTPPIVSAAAINNNLKTRQVIAATTTTPKQQVNITDAELLAMLEGLDVEQDSPKTSQNSTNNTVAQ